jgi:murein DD-endopeptidase MepM/ murein hydrolase activator NlpD
MKHWPLPNSNENHVSGKNEPGAFWKDTGEGFSAGIDLYAPTDSEIIAIEGGIVVDIGFFTTAKEGSGLKTTKFLVLRASSEITKSLKCR